MKSLDDALRLMRHQMESRVKRFISIVDTSDLSGFLSDEMSPEVQELYKSLPERWEPRPVAESDMWTSRLSPGWFPTVLDCIAKPGLKSLSLREYDALIHQPTKAPTNLSQDKDRCVRKRARSSESTTPCCTRFGNIFLPGLGRFFLGKEALRVQVPLSLLQEQNVAAALSDAAQNRLAGNAFNANTLLVVLQAALMAIAGVAYAE